MKSRKMISVYVLTTLLLLTLAACGPKAEPVSLSDIATYPGATTLERGENFVADMAADILEETAQEEGLTTEAAYYTLPDDATWNDVKKFYNDELAGTDWDTDPEFTEETEAFSSLGWIRGSGANEQALVVAYVPDLLGGPAALLIMIFSE